ncbi:MAG TPA: ABC transporter permease [Vicinamibacterales bacterium]|nr:ABC transporter permease [Vicinamibacterales bacterium]
MLQDIRYAVRLLGRTPGFAAAAILTLTLGIGMTCAIFSVVDAVLLSPIPFPDADRLVLVWETDRDTGTSHEPGAWPDFIDFQERSRRVDTFAGVIAGETTLTPDDGEPARLANLVVTREFLPMLGVTPIVGRSFTEEDERLGGPAIVLISEQLWHRLFQRDPAVVGQTVRLDDRPRTIVGVVPSGADFGVLQVLSAADYSRGFADRDPRSVVDVWAPLQANPEQLVRDTHPLLMLGRLAPGATLTSAQDELATIAADLERTYPSNKARGVFLEPLRQVIFGPTEPALLVLLAAVGVVLLISCVNVANLLLARGTTRRREVAVRSALGADGRQLARQFAVENLLLTTVASVFGVALAFGAVRVMVLMAPPEVPRLAIAAIDGRVLALALGLSAVVGCLFGLVPLVQSRRTDLQAALNADDTRGAAGGRDTSFARSSLVVAELALAVVLVIGAGLLIRSFWQLQQVDPGFDSSGVLKVQYQLPGSRYPVDFQRWPDVPSVHRFNAALLSRVAELPGVEGAAIAASHPLDAGFTNSFVIVGREEESRDLPEMSMRQVTPDYFHTLRVPIISGRLFDDRDATSAPRVVLLNEAAARRLFPAGDELGQQIAFWGARRTIVGVVGNEMFHGLTASAPIAAYLPLAQAPSRGGGAALLVRTTSEPEMLASAVRGAIAEIDPALAIFGVEPLATTVAGSLGTERFLMVLLVLFAALALVLAAVGIHGVLSYAVAQRTREIGIRLALGASPRTVMQLVIGQVARLTVLGLGIGLILGVGFSRYLAGLLFGVGTTDLATYAGVFIMLGAVAMLATFVPLRRAVRVDPTVALRQG